MRPALRAFRPTDVPYNYVCGCALRNDDGTTVIDASNCREGHSR